MRTDLVSGSGAAYNYPTSTTPNTAAAGATTSALANNGSAGTAAGSATSGTAANPATASTPASATETAELKKSVEALNRYIQPQQGSLEFSVDESSGKTLLKVVDTQTNEVLLQVPSKQALALSQSLGKTPGMLISDSA